MDESEGCEDTDNQRPAGQPDDRKGSSKIGRAKDSRTEKPKEIILDGWQQEALDYEGNLCLCTGRQVGKTYIMSRKAAKYMVEHPGSHIIVCSLTEDQAQLIIVMTLDFLERHYKTWIAKGNKKPTKNKIMLTNKSEILARPVGNTGDAVRGFTGDVLILDEAARFNEFIFASSKPTLLTTGGKIWICSTPFGKKGYFYECYENKNGRFKVIETNSWDVINTRQISDIWTLDRREAAIEFLEQEKKDMSRLEFAQEYLGKFVEDLNQFFDDDWINKVCTAERRLQPFPNKTYFLGVDIARMGEDLSVFSILEKVNEETIEQIDSQATRKTLTTSTFDRIVQLNGIYDFRQIGIDAGSGSLGVGILDFLLRNPGTRKKTVALNNLSRQLDYSGEKKKQLFKVDMYQNLLAMGQKRIIKLLDDDDVRLSLKSVQYEYITKEGELTKIRIFGNYTHHAESIIRAAWLANTKTLNHRITWI